MASRRQGEEGNASASPPAVEYLVLRCRSHEELANSLNEAGPLGWEPLHYAIWSRQTTVESAEHFVILRRHTAKVVEGLAGLAYNLERGVWDDHPEVKRQVEETLSQHGWPAGRPFGSED